MKKEYVIAIQGALAAAGAFLSDRLGILYPVLCVLMGMMVLDYITGMLPANVRRLTIQETGHMDGVQQKGQKELSKK